MDGALVEFPKSACRVVLRALIPRALFIASHETAARDACLLVHENVGVSGKRQSLWLGRQIFDN